MKQVSSRSCWPRYSDLQAPDRTHKFNGAGAVGARRHPRTQLRLSTDQGEDLGDDQAREEPAEPDLKRDKSKEPIVQKMLGKVQGVVQAGR